MRPSEAAAEAQEATEAVAAAAEVALKLGSE